MWERVSVLKTKSCKLRPFINSLGEFWRICSRQLLKTKWRKDNLLKTSSFSFCHNALIFFLVIIHSFIEAFHVFFLHVFKVVCCRFVVCGKILITVITYNTNGPWTNSRDGKSDSIYSAGEGIKFRQQSAGNQAPCFMSSTSYSREPGSGALCPPLATAVLIPVGWQEYWSQIQKGIYINITDDWLLADRKGKTQTSNLVLIVYYGINWKKRHFINRIPLFMT